MIANVDDADVVDGDDVVHVVDNVDDVYVDVDDVVGAAVGVVV